MYRLIASLTLTALIGCSNLTNESVNQRSSHAQASKDSDDVKAGKQTCPDWIQTDEASCSFLLRQTLPSDLENLRTALTNIGQDAKNDFWSDFGVLIKDALKVGSIDWTKVVALVEQHSNVDSGNNSSKKNYKPLLLSVLRRDCNSSHIGNSCESISNDQSDISLEVRVVGSNDFIKKTIPAEADSTTFENICPDNDTALIDVQFSSKNPAGIYKPNKDIIGGPIGFRRDQQTLWIGFEKEEVGGASPYHQNDDIVIQVKCPNSKRIAIANLCLDPNIPASPHAGGPRGKFSGPQYSGPGSDLITDEIKHGNINNPRTCSGL